MDRQNVLKFNALIVKASDVYQSFEGNSLGKYWIAYDAKTPFAFLITSDLQAHEQQQYRIPGGKAITLDIFICDKKYLGKGLAPALIRSFLQAEFSEVDDVFIDPETRNTRAVHVYEKVGFCAIEQFIASWHPVPHTQMVLHLKDLHKAT